jgi:oligopeptide/dipeptide ABC transporter ATP-binding protein
MNPDFIRLRMNLYACWSVHTHRILRYMKIPGAAGTCLSVYYQDLSLAWLFRTGSPSCIGSIMEVGKADEIIKHGLHPYTRALTKIMPTPGVNRNRERITLPGEIPSASEEIAGCKFRARCVSAMPICAEQRPELEEVGDGHFVACHLCGQ